MQVQVYVNGILYSVYEEVLAKRGAVPDQYRNFTVEISGITGRKFTNITGAGQTLEEAILHAFQAFEREGER